MSGLDGKGSYYPNGINVPAGKVFIDGSPITASLAEINTLAASGITNADLVKLHALTKTAAQLNGGAQLTETITGGSQSSNPSSLLGYGDSYIKSSGMVSYYTVGAPSAGARKSIYCTSASSTNTCVVTAGSGCTFDGSNGTATFNAAGDSLDLIGISSIAWRILLNTGSVAMS